MYKCPKCKENLDVIRSGYFINNWKYKDGFYVHDKDILVSPAACLNCDHKLDKITLSLIGLKHLHSKPKSGLGTNFYNIYRSHPDIYDAFSEAEDLDRTILKYIKSRLPTSSDKHTILDVGCGTGKYTRLLSPTSSRIFGQDNSSALLNYALKKSRSLKIDNITYLLSSGENIPLLNKSVDMVISTWATYPLNETVLEMRRVLKKKGKIIRIGAYKKDELTSLYPKFNQKELDANNKWFTNHGFTRKTTNIKIQFDNLEQSRDIISRITGANPSKIKKTEFSHHIVINEYIK